MISLGVLNESLLNDILYLIIVKKFTLKDYI